MSVLFLRHMLVAVGVPALCLLALGRAESPPLTLTPMKAFSATLPSGEGKILFYKYCVECHGAELIRKRLEGRSGWILRYWEDLVFEMIEQWGAPIGRQEVEPIARYLLQNFGAQFKPTSLETLLPAGDSRNQIARKCTPCHDPGTTIGLRIGLPAPAWEKLLERMQDYGAPVVTEEIEQLGLYLQQNLASDRDMPTDPLRELDSFLPHAPGRNLVLATCLSCHGPTEFKKHLQEPAGEDPYYWNRVVRRMRQRWEAPLEEQDEETVVQYLNSHFTRN